MTSFPPPQIWTGIINPAAGSGRRGRLPERLSRELGRAGLEHDLMVTEGPGHARELAADAIARGARRLLAVGGDGTVHEVANGILEASAPGAADVTLGIVPIGTGNDWVRSLGIPANPRAAIDILRRGETLLADVGTVRCRRHGAVQQANFLNVAGMGFDAFVCERRNRKRTAGGAGRFRYLVEALASLPAYRPVNAWIALPDQNRSLTVFLIAVGIGRCYGGGMTICPHAVLDDGLLDITVVEPSPLLKAVSHVPRLFAGRFDDLPEVGQFRADRLEVTAESPMLVTCDGEVVGEAPATFGIRPNALRVVVHPSSRQSILDRGAAADGGSRIPPCADDLRRLLEPNTNSVFG